MFNDFAALYIENYAKTNKRSWTCDDYCLDAHLKPYFGKFDLRDITPLNLEAYRAQRLKAGVKKSSTNREMALLKKMFNLAADWGFCEDNPVRKIRLFPEKDNLRERILTPEEEARLLPRCVPHLRPIVVFALNTGMRRTEILSLRWENLDIAQGEIIVRPEVSKSKKRRVVPMNGEVAAALMRIEKRGPFVFYNPATKKNIKDIKGPFRTAKTKAKIKGRLRVHDLRILPPHGWSRTGQTS